MPEPVNTALDDARKRARRRLVGAIVLALAAAVVVPVFLESDPKPLGPDVQIQIPAVDDSKFQNRLTPPVKGGTLDKGATPDKGAADSAARQCAGARADLSPGSHFTWAWTGWQRYGKIMLAPHRTQLAGGDRKLELGDITVSDSVPASTWTAP